MKPFTPPVKVPPARQALHARLLCTPSLGATRQLELERLLCMLWPQTAQASALGQSPVRGRNLSGKECTVCAGACNLGSFVLDDVHPPTQDSSSGFHAAGRWLNARSEPLRQRTLRQNGQGLLELFPRELSRTLLRLLLALHGFGNAHVIELGESLHHTNPAINIHSEN